MKLKNILFLLFLFGLLKQEVKAQESAGTFSLKECIEYGLKHHPTVYIYKNNVAKAHQTYRESLGAYLPQVNASAGLDDNLKLQQTVIPAGMLGPGSPEQRIAFGTTYNSNMAVQVSQKIYDQSLLSGLAANKSNKDYAGLQEAQNKENIIYNIAISYYQILVAQKQLELLENNKMRLEKILKVTELQAAQGVAKKVDIKQVQVNLNNVKAGISTLKNSLEIASNTLKNNMGLSQEEDIILSDTGRWLNQKPAPIQYSNFDFENTLDAQIQNAQISLLNYQRKTIKAQIVPSLSAYARYGANGFGQEFKGAFDPLLDFSSIGLQLNWSIFTGFMRDARYKSAVLDLNNAKINYRFQESMMSLQFQNAESKSQEARNSIIINKENMDLASEVYENTTLQYREGVASLSDLLNAELSYRDAQNNYINSLLNYYIADLAVKKANGEIETFFEEL